MDRSTGITQERHKPQSRSYDEVKRVLDDYQQGIRPTRVLELASLPVSCPSCKACQWKFRLRIANISRTFSNWKRGNDVALFHHFYVIAIASGYQAILPFEQFMGKDRTYALRAAGYP